MTKPPVQYVDTFKCSECDRAMSGTELASVISYPKRKPPIILRTCRQCVLAIASNKQKPKEEFLP